MEKFSDWSDNEEETLDDLDEPDSLLDIIDVEVENIDSILDSLLDDDDGHFDLWDWKIIAKKSAIVLNLLGVSNV